MRKKRNNREDSGVNSTWLNTYADLVTLLLCFFVMLFAMSTIDNQKFRSIILSFQNAGWGVLRTEGDRAFMTDYDNLLRVEPTPTPPMGLGQGEDLAEDEKFERIYRELSEFIERNNLGTSVSVADELIGIRIRFKDAVLFDKGSAVLKPEAIRILSEMAPLFKSYGEMIKVEGHTDSDPIRSAIYPSNWELSTARAVNVVKYFVVDVPEEYRISPDLMQAAGYGEYHPIAENTTEENKTKNRRIEVVILRKSANVR